MRSRALIAWAWLLLALLRGVATALGFAIVHLLPFAPASYGDLGPSALSWILAWVPLGVAIVVAAPAVRDLRDGQGANVPAL